MAKRFTDDERHAAVRCMNEHGVGRAVQEFQCSAAAVYEWRDRGFGTDGPIAPAKPSPMGGTAAHDDEPIRVRCSVCRNLYAVATPDTPANQQAGLMRHLATRGDCRRELARRNELPKELSLN